MSKLYTISVLAGVLLLSGKVSGDPNEIVVTTGPERGSYYYIGHRLETAMLLGHKQPITLLTSAGSIENLERLDDSSSPANVGLTQADALRFYLTRKPEFADEFVVLGDMGRECAFIVTGESSGVKSADDLKRESGSQISVGARGSGAAVTYDNMAELEPRFRHTPPAFVETSQALLELKAGGRFRSVLAALFVQRPGRISPPVRAILENPDLYRLVPILEGDLPGATLPDGSDVYQFDVVSLGGQRDEAVEVATLCTRALMLGARAKLGSEQRSRLATLMLESGAEIRGPQP